MINPRFAQYCRAQGNGPDEQLELDRKRWPGAIMAGYVLWHNERLREARSEIPQAFVFEGLWLHDIYDQWLQRRVDQLIVGDLSAEVPGAGRSQALAG